MILRGGNCMFGCVVNLISLSVLSLPRAVFYLCFVHPCVGRGSASLPADVPYTPVTHCSTPPPATWHSVCVSCLACSALLAVSLSGTLCVCQSAVPRVEGPRAGERCSPAQLVPSMCLLRGFHAHMCSVSICFW